MSKKVVRFDFTGDAENRPILYANFDGEYVLYAEYAKLAAELERLKNAWSSEHHEIEQLCAQAMGGFPWFKDSPELFPGATEADGVCVGDLVAPVLVQMLANRYKVDGPAQADLMEC